MFCNKYRHEAQAMRVRLHNLERELQQCQQQLEESRETQRAALEDCDEAKRRLAKHEQLFGQLSLFGESFLDVQRTLAALSQTLKKEKDAAVEAAASVGASVVTVQRLASNLHHVAEKAHETSANVEQL
ncbi:MAG: hypothetical protein AB7U30_03245, partial [Sulfuricellaceae bacterium]